MGPGMREEENARPTGLRKFPRLGNRRARAHQFRYGAPFPRPFLTSSTKTGILIDTGAAADSK